MSFAHRFGDLIMKGSSCQIILSENQALMRCITYGLSWKIFLHATAGICDVIEDVIEIGTVDEGNICILDDVIKVDACAVDDTDTEAVSLELTKT